MIRLSEIQQHDKHDTSYSLLREKHKIDIREESIGVRYRVLEQVGKTASSAVMRHASVLSDIRRAMRKPHAQRVDAQRVEAKVKLTLEQRLERARSDHAEALRAMQQPNHDPLAEQRLYVASKAVQRFEDRIAERDRDERERQQEREQAERDLLLADLRTPPDLQALVEEHGDWARITDEAWKKFNERMTRWRAHIASGDHFVQLHRTRRERTYAEARE